MTVDHFFTENLFIDQWARQFNTTTQVFIVSKIEQFGAARKHCLKTDGNNVRVGWLGGAGTATTIKNIRHLIEPVFRNPPEAELRVVGCKDLTLLDGFANIRFSVLFEYDEPTTFLEIAQFDIGPFPPPSDLQDYTMHGAQKAMLSMQAGVPPIALNQGKCARIIEDGITEMLVDSPQDWAIKLK